MGHRFIKLRDVERNRDTAVLAIANLVKGGLCNMDMRRGDRPKGDDRILETFSLVDRLEVLAQRRGVQAEHRRVAVARDVNWAGLLRRRP